MKEGKVINIEYKDWAGYKPFSPAMLRDLKKLVNSFKEQMVTDFIDFVDLKKTLHKQMVISKIE
jgi:hypothetical protein